MDLRISAPMAASCTATVLFIKKLEKVVISNGNMVLLLPEVVKTVWLNWNAAKLVANINLLCQMTLILL